jgi:hypothetical protein
MHATGTVSVPCKTSIIMSALMVAPIFSDVIHIIGDEAIEMFRTMSSFG